jgi:hypothetical protein
LGAQRIAEGVVGNVIVGVDIQGSAVMGNRLH